LPPRVLQITAGTTNTFRFQRDTAYSATGTNGIQVFSNGTIGNFIFERETSGAVVNYDFSSGTNGNFDISGGATAAFSAGANIASGTPTVTINQMRSQGGSSTGTATINATGVNVSIGSLSATRPGADFWGLGGTSTGTALTSLTDLGRTNAVVFNPGRTVGLDIADSGNTFTVGQVLNQTTGGFTKTGAGTAILSQTNTYTGATTVSAGKLIVNGSVSTSITTVQTGATLGGTGTVGALTIQAGGTHAPGNSPGIQPVGNYTQNGTLAIELNGLTAGTQHDRVDVTGTVDITGSTLSLSSMSYVAASNDLIFILLNDGSDAITGTFTGLAEGASVGLIGGLEFNITYLANGDSMGSPSFIGGNDIALKAIPEPSTALLGVLGLLAILRRRR
jgi:autotransporter-associated beta strand protein